MAEVRYQDKLRREEQKQRRLAKKAAKAASAVSTVAPEVPKAPRGSGKGKTSPLAAARQLNGPVSQGARKVTISSIVHRVSGLKPSRIRPPRVGQSPDK